MGRTPIDSAGFTEASTYDGSTYTSINLVGAYGLAVHSINSSGDVVCTWIDSNNIDHGGLLSGGSA